jgi:hypothetical protein
MPHSKGQLAKSYLVDGSEGFICLETGQTRMYCDNKTFNKGFKLHCRVCAECKNIGLDKSEFRADKEVIKEMINTKSWGARTTSVGDLNYKK